MEAAAVNRDISTIAGQPQETPRFQQYRCTMSFNMNLTFLFLLVILQPFDLEGQAHLHEPGQSKAPPPHKAWDQLLKKHVSPEGWVDYRGFEGDKRNLVSYLENLGKRPPGEDWSQEAILAYYINLYNAATVLLILDHYPLQSIRDIPRPWTKKRIRIEDKSYSLGELEHRILRKMGEPRIHFALVCASVSCPKLLPGAYLEETLESQLQEVTRDFINDPARNRPSPETAHLSRIFKWYRGDFENQNTSLIDFINRYLAQPLPTETPVSYLPYDWSLNENRG